MQSENQPPFFLLLIEKINVANATVYHLISTCVPVLSFHCLLLELCKCIWAPLVKSIYFGVRVSDSYQVQFVSLVLNSGVFMLVHILALG